MKPHPFAYRRADSLAAACAMLDAHGSGARLLAGGQSLIPSLNLRLSQPEILIDISRIATLRGIRIDGDEMVIGALTRHADIETSADVARHLPALAEAARQIAHPAIRNRGTIGGSIALADPAAEWPAAALAFAMRFDVVSSRGERRLEADGFFKGLYETALAPDEVLTAVRVPLVAGRRAAFGELVRRSGDYAIAGAFVTAGRKGANLISVRVAYFGTSDRARLARGAMAALEGSSGDEAAVASAKSALEADLDPIADLTNSRATKLHLSGVLLARLVKRLAA
ncbi:MAG: xanthine dehydrogenase family protein subunit M [Burkholderiales bacterium]|nr:xanthine dehydrogenase family protein subunit M [Burkholderiales bacterium]